LEAERGIEDEQIRRMRIPIDDNNPAGKVIQLGKSLRLARQPDEEQIKLKTNYLVEAVIYVPIMLGGTTFGVLSAVHREQGKQFSERDESLLRAIAQFAAIAIQNARLYEATDEALARRVKELSALNEVSRTVSTSLDLARVYQVLVKELNKYWPVQAIRLYTLNAREEKLELLFTNGADPEQEISIYRGLIGKVARTDTAVMSNQVAAHPDYAATVDIDGNPPDSFICVPLRVQENVIGVLALLNKEDGKFTGDDVKMLEAFSHPVATAIENARLFTETKRQQAAIETTAQVLRQPLIFLDDSGQIILSNQKAQTILENNMAQLFNAISEGVGRTQEVKIADETYLSTTEHVEDVGTIVVMQDITYVKQLEQDRSDFMHALSHDLKSPLTSIMGWVQLLERIVPAEGKIPQYMQKLLLAANSMLTMVNQLLHSAGKLDNVQIMKKQCRLERVVAKAMSDVEGAALSKGIEVSYEQTGTPYVIMADELRLYHMALNLVDNAIKYSPDDTEVQVRLDFAPKTITIEVQDQGAGIPEEDVPRIFDKYYRGSQSSSNRPGAGLGLAVVKDIVIAHEGEIVASNNASGGAKFTVTLPDGLPDTKSLAEQ
jgi:K+-sensing histidine kinase KdpD